MNEKLSGKNRENKNKIRVTLYHAHSGQRVLITYES